MYQYAFLFVIASVAIIFAIVQDLRTREIANWLNFSLLSVGLAYRAVYSLIENDLNFFIYGLIGTGFFVCLAYILYYSRAFAGGDAKLLIALGPIIPFESLQSGVIYGLGFVFALFCLGAAYSLVYTLHLAFKNAKEYKSAFVKEMKSYYLLVLAGVVIGFAGMLVLVHYSSAYSVLFFVAFLVLSVVFVHARAIENILIVLTPANKLTEGDWLFEDVKVGSKIVKKTVHGLSLKDIEILRKAKKKVWIKQGIPFSPAFLLALAAMVFYVLR